MLALCMCNKIFNSARFLKAPKFHIRTTKIPSEMASNGKSIIFRITCIYTMWGIFYLFKKIIHIFNSPENSACKKSSISKKFGEKLHLST